MKIENKLDGRLKKIINNELKRQQSHIELIASENYVSTAVLEAAGSILTNKYAEGYPNKRYYGGCEEVDKIESLAIETAKKIFDADHANVQPHSGSQANAAVYLALLKPGDKVLAMDLSAGGHLTHGHPVNFSGKIYNFVSYGVNKDEVLDYVDIEKKALKEKPKLIIAGASAYSRTIDFKKIKDIAKKINAYFMVDMAHIAGLVAAKLHPSPIPCADVVTTTTHKTLRGPRGGMILCKKELKKKIDSAVFPGSQGGPLEHIIAAKAQCFIEALSPEFKKYQEQVIKNSKVMEKEFKKNKIRVVANATDNHLINLDIKSSLDMTGKKASEILEKINVVVNKNLIPFDKETPFVTSGIRIGTPAMTTRGFKENEFLELTKIIISILQNYSDENIELNKSKVAKLISKFPIYKKYKI